MHLILIQVVLAVGAILSVAGSPVQGAEQDLSSAVAAPTAETVLGWATAIPGMQMRFIEHRQNRLLSEPLVRSGYVSMSKAGVLSRVVDEPYPETATIDGARATLQRDGRVRSVDLNRRGPGAAYMRALYALLRGDREVLRQTFDSVVSGDRDAWELVLTPADSSVERSLERILVIGSGDRVVRMRMERSDGAWQDMRLLPTTP